VKVHLATKLSASEVSERAARLTPPPRFLALFWSVPPVRFLVTRPPTATPRIYGRQMGPQLEATYVGPGPGEWPIHGPSGAIFKGEVTERPDGARITGKVRDWPVFPTWQLLLLRVLFFVFPLWLFPALGCVVWPFIVLSNAQENLHNAYASSVPLLLLVGVLVWLACIAIAYFEFRLATTPGAVRHRKARREDASALVDWLVENFEASPIDAPETEPRQHGRPKAETSLPASRTPTERIPLLLFGLVVVTALTNWPIPGGILGFPFAVAGAWYQQLPHPSAEIENLRSAMRPLVLPATLLSFVLLFLTARALGLGARINLGSIKSMPARILLVAESTVVFSLILAGFLVGFGFAPPDRRVFMNDFRWEVIWLISGVVEGVVVLSVAGLLVRAERRLRPARQ
jgi:hypothetical protein